MDLTQIIHYLPQILHGTLITIMLMVCALSIGITLAVIMTLCSLSKRFYLKNLVDAYVFFIRGTPLLVQIYLIYYGSGQFAWLRDSALWYIFREPFACAVIAFALNTCGYTVALFRGAIQSVPKGEYTACKALGMSRWLALRRVILPRAMRIVLPAYSNEVILILKGTSLASTITLMDLFGITNQIISQTYETIPFLLVAGVIYLLLNSILVGAFKWFESRANVYLQHG